MGKMAHKMIAEAVTRPGAGFPSGHFIARAGADGRLEIRFTSIGGRAILTEWIPVLELPSAESARRAG